MKKTFEIIAIAVIAVGASQLASAQASDPAPPAADGPRAADQRATARDEVRARLEGAGFSDIQIVSESFLVRAIGPDGDPVLMVVRPGRHGMRPEISGDPEEMAAREPSDPDVLGDLLEGAEEDAVAPTPRDAHVAKSSKLTDRAPTERAQPPQMNQSASEAARMRDEGVRQSAEETMPGRPDGVPADVKNSAQRALDLSTVQRAEIWRQLGTQQATNPPAGFQPQVGATVPASLQLKSLPNSVSSEVPQVQTYNYAMVQSQLLIVDPATKKIVSIITE